MCLGSLLQSSRHHVQKYSCGTRSADQRPGRCGITVLRFPTVGPVVLNGAVCIFWFALEERHVQLSVAEADSKRLVLSLSC